MPHVIKDKLFTCGLLTKNNYGELKKRKQIIRFMFHRENKNKKRTR